MLENLKKELGKITYNIDNLKVYAFVGASGTGKSYKVQQVAGDRNIEAIIDDGLLISITKNKVLAGISAKKAKTKIQTIRDALFQEEAKQEEILEALKKYKIKSLLILGTSDAMVEKIAENLKLPEIINKIYIEEVSTAAEIEKAKKTRKEEGKHVVPVPTFEVKKDFSGILLSPLQMFKSKKTGNTYMSKKSIIRPTFSYIGKFVMAERVFRDLIKHITTKQKGIYKLEKVIITRDSVANSISIYLELIFNYGYNIKNITEEYREKVYKEIEDITQVNVTDIDIKIKDIHFE